MKATDLREKNAEDLRELAKTLQRDVFQNRLKNFTNRLDDTSAIRKSKRDYARVVTLLRERDKGIVRAATAPAQDAPAAETKPTKKDVAKVEAAAAPAEDRPKKTAAKKSAAKTPKATKKDEAK
jgi:large subunit ribosomal protein L29